MNSLKWWCRASSAVSTLACTASASLSGGSERLTVGVARDMTTGDLSTRQEATIRHADNFGAA
jgi:hypothetical protein